MNKKLKFYVVWEGKVRGVFGDWASCKASVDGFPDARYMAFDTRELAEKALRGNYWSYVKKKPAAKSGTADSRAGIPLQEALTVDAACSGNPGVLEYRGVWMKDGSEYFRMGPYPEGTVNIGEFLAIVHGLAQLQRDGLEVPVYSDSKTAIKWVRDCHANTKLIRNEVNDKLFEYVARAETWLKEHTYTNPVLKWETKSWGEIPADYGRK